MVETELERVVSDRDLPLYSMMEYHLGWSVDDSVRTSPPSRELGALCLAACSALGGETADALPAAAAVELVQNFCEIHDDIEAGRVARNARDSVWWKWGPAQAINAGDGMHALARLALFGLLDRGMTAESVFDAVRVLDDASLAACEGRFMDLEAQERLDITSEAYLRMATRKSGALFASATELGALVSGQDDDTRRAFAECGRELGVAVQIAGDVAQITAGLDGVEPPSEDFMNKKKLFPVVRAFEIASPSERRALGDYYFKRVLEPSDARSLASIVNDLGAIDESLSEMRRRLEASIRSAGKVLDSADAEAEMEDLIRYLAGAP